MNTTTPAPETRVVDGQRSRRRVSVPGDYKAVRTDDGQRVEGAVREYLGEGRYVIEVGRYRSDRNGELAEGYDVVTAWSRF